MYVLSKVEGELNFSQKVSLPETICSANILNSYLKLFLFTAAFSLDCLCSIPVLLAVIGIQANVSLHYVRQAIGVSTKG